MTRGCPQSQTRAMMHEKGALAHRLLAAGLTVRQVSTQLRCSPAFVRRIRGEMYGPETGATERSTDRVGSVRGDCHARNGAVGQ